MRNPSAAKPRTVCDRMLLGLTGSIGIHYFVYLFVTLKAAVAREVRVIQTPNAARMFEPHLVSAMLGCDVWTDPYDRVADVRVPHVELAEWAGLFLVMPATANTIASAAQGHADTLLTLTVLASARPVGFVPSMSDQMWRAPSTQRNVAQVREDGHLVLGQDSGQGMGFSVGSRSVESTQDSSAIQRFILELAAACSRANGEKATG